MNFLTHYPRIFQNQISTPREPSSCEKILSDWFGQPVILLSSGKAGLNIVLKALEMHRYKSKLAVPSYLSTCVLNSITPFAFPVKIGQESDGILWYHQYGFQQTNLPLQKNVIEDCAHSFFSSQDSGERSWVSDIAIFSLPKFFNIEGMAGGIIIRDPRLEEKLRSILEDAPKDIYKVRTWMRKIVTNAFNIEGSTVDKLFINSAYELLLEFIRPNAFDLAGFPESTEEIRKIGYARKIRIDFIVDFFGEQNFPDGLFVNNDKFMPFALPYFSILDEKMRVKANNSLQEIGIHAGIYNIDIMRNSYNPEYRPCILLPCHQNVPMDKLEEACKLLSSFEKC